MRIHFDVKFLKIISDGHFSLMVTVQPVVFILISVSICGKYSWEKLFEGILLSNVFARRVTHISRSNFLYEKILRITRGGRESDRKRQVPFSIALHFFFFRYFSPSSLPFLSLFFFFIRCCYSNIKRERFYASTPPFPPSQRDPSNEDNRNEKTVKGKKKWWSKQIKKKKYDRETEQKRSNGPATQH